MKKAIFYRPIMSKRIPRVNSLIRNELSRILLKEVDFPQGILVTLTRVETSSDLQESKVYISVLPSGKTKEILKILNKIIYGLQKTLNQRLKIRPIPRIKFVKEEKTNEAERIEELLEVLKKE